MAARCSEGQDSATVSAPPTKQHNHPGLRFLERETTHRQPAGPIGRGDLPGLRAEGEATGGWAGERTGALL